MRAAILIIWLILDVLLTVFFVGGGVYLAIWRHCSGWWVVLGLVISSCIGSKHLYKSLKYFIIGRTENDSQACTTQR